MRRTALAALAAFFVLALGGGAAVALTGATAATPFESCEQSVSTALISNRIVGNTGSYRKDNPTEYAAVRAYLDGGSRPTTSLTNMGLHLVALEDTCRALSVPPPTTTATTTTTTPPPPGLGVDPATMQSGGSILREDNALAVSPVAGLWGAISCVSSSRVVHVTSGGDPRPKANGSSQGNSAYRQLSVLNGDDYYGERCELGYNEYRYGENVGSQTTGTFALYREGERKITFFSMRYGAGFTSALSGWQTILQFKQAQPYGANGPVNSAPILEMQLWGNRLRLHNSWSEKWTTTVPVNGAWIRYALDVTYSQNASLGKIKVHVDLNADGDFLDAGEVSPQLTMATLAYVTTQGSGTIPVGGSIPGHMRIGVYHNSSVYGSATVDIDNVQVVG